MKLNRALTVTVTEGDLELRMGKALTTFAYKGQDKFVLRASEVDTFIALAQKAKQEMADFVAAIKQDEDEGKPLTTGEKGV